MPGPFQKPTDPSLVLELAKRHLAKEMPNELASATIQPKGWLGSLTRPFADAITSPMNTISYEPDILTMPQPQVEDIFAHELTHVRQNNEQPLYRRLVDIFLKNQGPYQQRSDELEAFQTEKDRILRDHRPGNPMMPQFGTDAPVERGDINLPVQQAKRR